MACMVLFRNIHSENSSQSNTRISSPVTFIHISTGLNNSNNNISFKNNNSNNNNNNNRSDTLSNKIRAKRKPSQTAVAVTTTTAADEFSHHQHQYHHHYQDEKTSNIQRSSPKLASFLLKNSTSSSSSGSSSSSAASPDKMLGDRMLIGLNVNNIVDNNKKHCDNSTTSNSLLLLDKIKVKNEPLMDSLSTIKNGLDLGNNNNDNNSNNININSSTGNSSNSIGGNNNNSIKRERLSPSGNGDIQSSISRSRSATPSSFPGTPPQAAHLTDIMTVNQNFSPTTANVLSTAAVAAAAAAQTRNNEFQARNYSDFMRSLAAKYNNANDNTTQRSQLFDTKTASSSRTGSNKETSSSPDIKRQQGQNIIPPQVPFVSSLLSSLPFSATVFPPLIDMSSTQALVTLARAAKEAEIQNILRSAQKRSSSTPNISPTLRASLTPTPQQAVTQLSPSPFVLPTHLQQQQQQQHQRQSSPLPSSGVSASPLDLSSTPLAKRPKFESNSPSNTVSEKSSTKISEVAKTNCNVTVEESTSGSTTATTTAIPSLPRIQCQAQSEEVNGWNVEDVCNFVGSIDICAEYVENFREQCIDGTGLPLLTEEHLTKSLGMKLGPALKLKSVLAKKLGGPCPCISCTTLAAAAAANQHHHSHLASIAAIAAATYHHSSSLSSSSPSLSQQQQQQQQTSAITATTSATITAPTLTLASSIASNQSLSTLNINNNNNNIKNNNNSNNNNNNNFSSEVISNNTANNINNLNLKSSSLLSSSSTPSNNIPRPASADSGS